MQCAVLVVMFIRRIIAHIITAYHIVVFMVLNIMIITINMFTVFI